MIPGNSNSKLFTVLSAQAWAGLEGGPSLGRGTALAGNTQKAGLPGEPQSREVVQILSLSSSSASQNPMLGFAAGFWL